MPVELNRRAKVLLPVFLIVLVGFSVRRLMTPATSEGPFSSQTTEGSKAQGAVGLSPAMVGSLTRLHGSTMGTTYSVVLAPPYAKGRPSPDQLQRLSAAVQGELDRLSALMSTWDETSELMRFNRTPVGTPFALSPDTRRVLAVSQRVSALSSGAFDVTVAPLVRLWGFGAKAGEQQAPVPEALAAARRRVNYHALRLEGSNGVRTIDGLEVDLSAVAKGDAVDRVSLLLTREGYDNHLVEVGGEMRAAGAKPTGAWRAGIELPDALSRRVRRAVELHDLSIATSGDYRNYYERDGKRYSHTIDPRSAAPVRHALASVSVVHKSCAEADAWATALSVLGPEEGMVVAERERLAALFLVRTAPGEFESRSTQGFAALTQSE